MNRLSLWIALVFATCFAVSPLGCGDDDGASTDSDSDSDGDSDGDSDTDSDSDSDTDSDTDSDGDWGRCMRACDAPADCVPATPDATHDEDNYSCEVDHCAHLGCLSKAECETLHPDMPNIECNTGADPPECTIPCGTAADCAITSTILYGEDNWACDDELCVYTGCTSDDECQEAYPATELACAQYVDPAVCFPSCAEPADCTDDAVPADLFDEEHWLCTGGACEHRGCLSTQECQDSDVYGADFICVF